MKPSATASGRRPLAALSSATLNSPPAAGKASAKAAAASSTAISSALAAPPDAPPLAGTGTMPRLAHQSVVSAATAAVPRLVPTPPPVPPAALSPAMADVAARVRAIRASSHAVSTTTATSSSSSTTTFTSTPRPTVATRPAATPAPAASPRPFTLTVTPSAAGAELHVTVRLPAPAPLPHPATMTALDMVRELQAVTTQREAETAAALQTLARARAADASPPLQQHAARTAASATTISDSATAPALSGTLKLRAYATPEDVDDDSDLGCGDDSAASHRAVKARAARLAPYADTLFATSATPADVLAQLPVLATSAVTGCALVTAHVEAPATPLAAYTVVVDPTAVTAPSNVRTPRSSWRLLPAESAASPSAPVPVVSPPTHGPGLASPHIVIVLQLPDRLSPSTRGWLVPPTRPLPGVLAEGAPPAVDALAALKSLLASALYSPSLLHHEPIGDGAMETTTALAAGGAAAAATAARALVHAVANAPALARLTAVAAAHCRPLAHAALTPAQSQARVHALVLRLTDDFRYDITPPLPPLAITRLGTTHVAEPWQLRKSAAAADAPLEQAGTPRRAGGVCDEAGQLLTPLRSSGSPRQGSAFRSGRRASSAGHRDTPGSGPRGRAKARDPLAGGGAGVGGHAPSSHTPTLTPRTRRMLSSATPIALRSVGAVRPAIIFNFASQLALPSSMLLPTASGAAEETAAAVPSLPSSAAAAAATLKFASPGGSGAVMPTRTPQPLRARSASAAEVASPLPAALARFVSTLDCTRAGVSPAAFDREDHRPVLGRMQVGLEAMTAQRRQEEDHMQRVTRVRPYKNTRSGGYGYLDVDTGREVAPRDYERLYEAEVHFAAQYLDATTKLAWEGEASARVAELAALDEATLTAEAARVAATRAARCSWWDQDVDDGLDTAATVVAPATVTLPAGMPFSGSVPSAAASRPDATRDGEGSTAAAPSDVGSLLRAMAAAWSAAAEQHVREEIDRAVCAALEARVTMVATTGIVPAGGSPSPAADSGASCASPSSVASSSAPSVTPLAAGRSSDALSALLASAVKPAASTPSPATLASLPFELLSDVGVAGSRCIAGAVEALLAAAGAPAGTHAASSEALESLWEGVMVAVAGYVAARGGAVASLPASQLALHDAFEAANAALPASAPEPAGTRIDAATSPLPTAATPTTVTVAAPRAGLVLDDVAFHLGADNVLALPTGLPLTAPGAAAADGMPSATPRRLGGRAVSMETPLDVAAAGVGATPIAAALQAQQAARAAAATPAQAAGAASCTVSEILRDALRSLRSPAAIVNAAAGSRIMSAAKPPRPATVPFDGGVAGARNASDGGASLPPSVAAMASPARALRSTGIAGATPGSARRDVAASGANTPFGRAVPHAFGGGGGAVTPFGGFTMVMLAQPTDEEDEVDSDGEGEGAAAADTAVADGAVMAQPEPAASQRRSAGKAAASAAKAQRPGLHSIRDAIRLLPDLADLLRNVDGEAGSRAFTAPGRLTHAAADDAICQTLFGGVGGANGVGAAPEPAFDVAVNVDAGDFGAPAIAAVPAGSTTTDEGDGGELEGGEMRVGGDSFDAAAGSATGGDGDEDFVPVSAALAAAADDGLRSSGRRQIYERANVSGLGGGSGMDRSFTSGRRITMGPAAVAAGAATTTLSNSGRLRAAGEQVLLARSGAHPLPHFAEAALTSLERDDAVAMAHAVAAAGVPASSASTAADFDAMAAAFAGAAAPAPAEDKPASPVAGFVVHNAMALLLGDNDGVDEAASELDTAVDDDDSDSDGTGGGLDDDDGDAVDGAIVIAAIPPHSLSPSPFPFAGFGGEACWPSAQPAPFDGDAELDALRGGSGQIDASGEIGAQCGGSVSQDGDVLPTAAVEALAGLAAAASGAGGVAVEAVSFTFTGRAQQALASLLDGEAGAEAPAASCMASPGDGASHRTHGVAGAVAATSPAAGAAMAADATAEALRAFFSPGLAAAATATPSQPGSGRRAPRPLPAELMEVESEGGSGVAGSERDV